MYEFKVIVMQFQHEYLRFITITNYGKEGEYALGRIQRRLTRDTRGCVENTFNYPVTIKISHDISNSITKSSIANKLSEQLPIIEIYDKNVQKL